MTKLVGWRGFLTFAMIDAMLMLTAGAAWAAAPAAPATTAVPGIPALLVMGVGLVGAGWFRGGRRQMFVRSTAGDGIDPAGRATLTAQ